MIKKALLAVVVFLLFISWSSDPNVNTPVCTAAGRQFNQEIISDGAGGVIIAWIDNRGGDWDVYMQRLSASGKALWGNNGRVVYAGSDTKNFSNLIADGSGGVLLAVGEETIAYQNGYAGRVKRVNSSGRVVWTSSLIDDSMSVPSLWALVSDGSGGAFFFWEEKISDDTKIYGQHVDNSGNIVWAAGGIPVASTEGSHSRLGAIADGQGGAYVAWIDGRSLPNTNEVTVQRIDGSGNLLWGVEGIMVSDKTSYPRDIKLHRDNQNGVYVVWPYAFDYDEIYMQRLNSAGTKLWAAGGVSVYKRWYGDFEYFGAVDLVSANAGGLYMLVENSNIDACGYSRYEADLQHIDASGNTAWGSIGIPINADVRLMKARLAAGAAGKAIVAWAERDSWDVLLKAQLFNSTGTPQWAADGLTVSDANFRQRSYINITSNGRGGAIAAWDNGVALDEDLYAQNICASGGIGSCAIPIAVIQGDRFGGIAPATIKFDGSGSYDPDGKVVQWSWDLGDDTTASTPKVTHTYNDIGVYKVTLRVKDNSGQWSKPVKVSVKTFSVDALTAVFDFNTNPVKAKKRGQASVRASLYDKPRTADERPIPIDLGLTFKTDKGSWQNDLAFYSTTYSRSLAAETPGTATVSAVLEGKVLGTAKVTFAWLLPPANVTVNLEVFRSLFMGEYDAHISWSENPKEVFTPAKYRVYRSTDGSAFELVAEVDASTFSYVDENLPAANEYSWALSMVDEMGDESDLAVISKRL